MDELKKTAILSTSNKNGLLLLASWLEKSGLELVASGGTADYLRNGGFQVTDVSSVTKFAEMLDGRVKTLHPAIYGGILARNSDSHLGELQKLEIPLVEVVVCNLYPFEEVINKENFSDEDAIENIDIGGVTLLRAAAKNFERVLTICDPSDYKFICNNNDDYRKVKLQARKALALKAFTHTSDYDARISDYFRKAYFGSLCQYNLRYGMNPHQKPAQIFNKHDKLPFKVLNGSPGFINLCDALNAWQLVKELESATNFPAAASFKHVSPAGAAVGIELDPVEARVCMVEDLMPLTKLATAYARARGADRMSSFGDFIAISQTCDECTAKLISREVSDGIIAPAFTNEAYEILKKKKGGNYCMIEMDEEYDPSEIEQRTIFGLILEQKRNTAQITSSILENIVSKNKSIDEETRRDLLIATITVKYTQSNSVCLVHRGQVVGIGAGQQSRIHCTRLAAEKAYRWRLRHYIPVLNLNFKEGVKRADKANTIDNFIGGTVETDLPSQLFNSFLKSEAIPLGVPEMDSWVEKWKGVCLASDAFFPFRDCIDSASSIGVQYVISPSGSKNDEDVTAACDDHGMVLIHTDTRLFHH